MTVARVESTSNQKEMRFSVIMEMVSLFYSLLLKKNRYDTSIVNDKQ